MIQSLGAVSSTGFQASVDPTGVNRTIDQSLGSVSSVGFSPTISREGDIFHSVAAAQATGFQATVTALARWEDEADAAGVWTDQTDSVVTWS